MSTHSPKIFTPNTYPERAFDLHGLDGISDAQIEEHLALYAGYVKHVNVLNKELATMVGHGQASGKNPEFAELTRLVIPAQSVRAWEQREPDSRARVRDWARK